MSRIIGRTSLVVRSAAALYKELALSAATLLPHRREAAPRLDARARPAGA